MTKGDIIRMAREASSIPINTRLSNTTHDLVHFTTDELERFAHLVTAAEREACAKVCAELHWPWRMGDNSGPNECAAAIRARSRGVDRTTPPYKPDWKAEYLKTVDLHCETLDELREAQADLKEARHANEKHIARIVDLQTHIQNFDGEDR